MNEKPQKITLDEWDARYQALRAQGLSESAYGGSLRRHADDGDTRLLKLQFDNSPASLRLWNFLLSEEERLHQARQSGKTIIGTMKDLGTVPVLAYSFPETVAFYPDGAWWIPCVMEQNTSLLRIADSMGIDESFCPVRAMLGAFETRNHFPIPDRLFCSVGATCDDFSAIAQRLEAMEHSIFWWEIPHRRPPDKDETPVALPGGFLAPLSQVQFVESELDRIKTELEKVTGHYLPDSELAEGIQAANRVRSVLRELRHVVYQADACPLPSLEMQIAEMLAIHFCSDREESVHVIQELLKETQRRIAEGDAVLHANAVRVFWVNPTADLRLMNLLEDCGGRVCGSDYMFAHAIDPIPDDVPPLRALACMALADPMAGSSRDRAERIIRDIQDFGAEAAVISRIPGASHCALEGEIIRDCIQQRLDIPILEIETPPIVDSMLPSIRTRLEALVESARGRRKERQQ